MLASRLETARVSVGREVQAPFRLEGPSDSKRSALQQRIPDALQCSQRVLIDALGGDDDEPPAHLVEFLTTEDVG